MKFSTTAIVVTLTIGAGLAFAWSCGALKKKAEEAGGAKVHFSGTVKRADGQHPIKGANVVFVKLLDVNAIKQLVEIKKIPDGKGGQANRPRIKVNLLQDYVDKNELERTTTDDQGHFETDVPIQAYLVYTYGPGPKPGTTADAYGVHYWGINPETGELDLEHLIGKDLKLNQSNDKIVLNGGPVLPAPPAAGTALPPPALTPPPRHRRIRRRSNLNQRLATSPRLPTTSFLLRPPDSGRASSSPTRPVSSELAGRCRPMPSTFPMANDTSSYQPN